VVGGVDLVILGGEHVWFGFAGLLGHCWLIGRFFFYVSQRSH
jgi:hypothetical protein